MTKGDRIWLAVGVPAFVFMVLFINRSFSKDDSIAGRRNFKAKKYQISLSGARFQSFWRNFYYIRKDESAKEIFIRIKASNDLLYKMLNFNIDGINPKKAVVTGAATSEIDKHLHGIGFAIRVGSRKDILLHIFEK